MIGRRLLLAALALAASTACAPQPFASKPAPVPAPAPSPSEQPGPEASQSAAAVLRTYYAAINRKDYRQAYACWERGGAASGQTFAAFAQGFAGTARVDAEIGVPGPIEGAAGSRYVTIPVTLTAATMDGVRQRFAGTYVLRRSVVDGATPEQRAWHIDSAKIARLRE